MACEQVDRWFADRTIADRIDRLAALGTDPRIRALFSGFARADRRAA